jgi:hypothetical protein
MECIPWYECLMYKPLRQLKSPSLQRIKLFTGKSIAYKEYLVAGTVMNTHPHAQLIVGYELMH